METTYISWIYTSWRMVDHRLDKACSKQKALDNVVLGLLRPRSEF